MLKTITIHFPDDFMPPDVFDGDETSLGQCGPCPFFRWNDDYGQGYCECIGEDDPFDDSCPIRKYFK